MPAGVAWYLDLLIEECMTPLTTRTLGPPATRGSLSSGNPPKCDPHAVQGIGPVQNSPFGLAVSNITLTRVALSEPYSILTCSRLPFKSPRLHEPEVISPSVSSRSAWSCWRLSPSLRKGES